MNEHLTLGGLLARATNTHPQRDAVVLPDRRITYAELTRRAETVALRLLARGVEHGDHVGIRAHNSVEFVEAFFGVTLIGAVAVLVNPRSTAAELRYQVTHADLVALLCSDRDAPEITAATRVLPQALPDLEAADGFSPLHLADAPTLRTIVLMAGHTPTWSAAAEGSAQPTGDALPARRDAVSPDELAAMIYTSGTTARPKGVLHTHQTLIRASTARFTERLELTEEERSWCPAPLCHVAALGVLIGTVGRCGTFLTLPGLDPAAALRQLTDERVTTAWVMFPPFALALVAHPDLCNADLSHVRNAMTVPNPAAIEATEALFPNAKVLSGYGMTEVVGITSMPASGSERQERVTTCGPPFAGVEIAAFDAETDHRLPPSTPGELRIRGYNVFREYYRDPEATRAAIDQDGWYHTGDIGVVDERGSVTFQGRLRDMLKVGGENVAPLEIETTLLAHPAVRAAAVVGAPDPRLDEVPVAFVELEPGRRASSEDLTAHCRRALAGFKVPRQVRFLSEGDWPMSETKINKRALVERLRQEQ